MNANPRKVRTCLWYDGQAEEAARLYVSLLPESGVDGIIRPEPDKPALAVDFNLCGTPYQALNGGPMFQPSEFASIVVATDDQVETDRLWGALIEDGGSPSRCGWLKDRFGVSWQIVPRAALARLSDADREAAGRAMHALMKMDKIDVAAIEAAFAGT